MPEDVITLDHPEREKILAEIQGDFKKLNRLHSVAQPTTIDNKRFPSMKEANRYLELKLLERKGVIQCLRTQVTFPLVVNNVPIFPQGYRADFVYIEEQQDEWKSWKIICEDSKGVRTDIYTVKAKLMLAVWGITVRET